MSGESESQRCGFTVSAANIIFNPYLKRVLDIVAHDGKGVGPSM